MSLKETEKEWWELLNLMNLILGLKEERGKRGRGAAEKTPVFWLLEQDEFTNHRNNDWLKISATQKRKRKKPKNYKKSVFQSFLG